MKKTKKAKKTLKKIATEIGINLDLAEEYFIDIRPLEKPGYLLTATEERKVRASHKKFMDSLQEDYDKNYGDKKDVESR